jgi:cytochrome P450
MVRTDAEHSSFAGSETTALTLSGILYNIFRTPCVYTKLTAEIDAAVKAGLLSTPHIAYNEASKLPYLVACIKEGIRMHPITGVSFPRHAPQAGCMVGGYYIPGNTRIGVNPGVIHFDKSVFGDDAETFRPERWIEGDANRMDGFIMQFGMGARTCLGKNVSLLIWRVFVWRVQSADILCLDFDVRDLQGYSATYEEFCVRTCEP